LALAFGVDPTPILECRDPMMMLAYSVMVEKAEKYRENANTDLANKLGQVLGLI
jgi:hypothetical protein